MSIDREKIRREIHQRSERQKAEKKARAERIRAATKYRAIVNIDFTSPRANEYQRLIAALMQLGWKYLETSALSYEGDLPNVLVAMELISKQCQAGGTLSALTFHVQGSTDLRGKPYPQARSFPYALRDIRNKPLPEPRLPDAPDAAGRAHG
jgi:hypothetical protein